jgi:hypothetical protein
MTPAKLATNALRDMIESFLGLTRSLVGRWNCLKMIGKLAALNAL